MRNGFFNTLRDVLAVYAVTSYLLVYVVAEVEGWSGHEAAWWAVVTLTTTGYGDIAPVTPVGRYLASLLMIFGWVLNILIGAMLAAKLIVDSDAFTHVEQEQLKADVRSILSKLETRGE